MLGSCDVDCGETKASPGEAQWSAVVGSGNIPEASALPTACVHEPKIVLLGWGWEPSLPSMGEALGPFSSLLQKPKTTTK